MKPPERIQTRRLILRRTKFEDAELFFNNIVHDPQVTMYLSQPAFERVEEVEAVFNRLLTVWDDGTNYTWSILLKDGPLMGGIGLRIKGWKAELGFVLGQRYWNHGYCTEALKAVVDWVKQEPKILRLWAVCDIENIASACVLENCGFTREGILKNWAIHAQVSEFPRDCFAYSIVKSN